MKSQWAMSWWTKLGYWLLNIPVSLFVRSKPIPDHPLEELAIDPNRPVLYVLPYRSKIDLLVVRSLCKKFALPDPLKMTTINDQQLPAFIFVDKGPGIFASPRQKRRAIAILRQYLAELQQNEDLDVQLLPVSVMFGRKPDREGKKTIPLQELGSIQKFYKLITTGRDCYTRFSHIVPMHNILQTESNVHVLAHKLARVARIHFAKQRLAAVGPTLPNRQAMLKKLLNSTALKEAIEDEIKTKDISAEKAQKNAMAMLNEIAADFNYRMLRLTDIVLTWAWNKLYQGLKVRNAEPVRELAQNRHEIVYAPCHRSHMDYLLLSYVLHRQGLVPPHIAAGINLNFWPAGPIFRRLGAFFIRRSFRGNKLYTAIFREYLAELFLRGYSVEYFVEGGRSRTGRLLDPKTGMLTMTIQTLLRGDPRPITIVPVYIGYEHVLEVATYANELRGAAKKQESLWRTLRAFTKLKKLGYGYVNFGEPIALNQFLNQHVPEWRDSIDPVEPQRPNWLMPTTNTLATEIMQKINRSAAVNAMNLCSTILLASPQKALSKTVLLEQMQLMLSLLRNVSYSELVTIPDTSANLLFEHAKEMDKFEITTDAAGELISLSQEQAILMTYYRNNIQHLIIIPALIARMIIRRTNITRDELLQQLLALYPLIKAELFIWFDEQQLLGYCNRLLDELKQQGLINEQSGLTAQSSKITALKLLAACADETLQRYCIALSLLQHDNSISRGKLEKESRLIAERLSLLYGINAPEFFDKDVFSTLVSTLREQGYLNEQEEGIADKINAMCQILNPLVSQAILSTIDEVRQQSLDNE